MLDNLRGKMDSPYLEALLTAERFFGVRVPHRGEIQVDPGRFCLFATSNAMEMTRDLANRCSIVRLRKQAVGYAFHRFPEGDVLDHIRANQPRFLGAVFTVLQEWLRLGRPATAEAGHDFREWARAMDYIVQNLLGTAPLLAGHAAARERVSDPAKAFVRNVALLVEQTGGLSGEHSASELYALAEANGLDVPGLRVPEEHVGARQVGVAFGRALGGAPVVETDGFEVTLSSRAVFRTDGEGYRPIKVYRFKRLLHNPTASTASRLHTSTKTVLFSDSPILLEAVAAVGPSDAELDAREAAEEREAIQTAELPE
jgi:hypothetical protein